MVEVESIDIPATHGGKPAVQVILRDITEKKQRDEQAFRSQRMESLGSLAAGIAHDLNNALAPILMVASILHSKFPAPSEQRLLDIVDESAQHAANMVKQVLTFARGTEVERAMVDVGGLMEELNNVAEHTFPKSIRMRTELGSDLWPLIGNSTQIHQVLLNLCVNARDAMPKGGTLSLTVGNCQIDATHGGLVPEATAGPYLRFTVADTGTGMSEEVRKRIFEPFYTTKAPGKGTGIGLSTVQKIVEAHGGFLFVTSVLNQGTEFHVYFPAQLKPVPVAAETSRGVPPVGLGEMILVVDDEAAIRSILSLTLQSCGYRVMVAADGAQAVALCAKNPIVTQLLITDMDMPIMDGPATIMAIRALAPQLKVIATSGTRSLAADIGTFGAQAFLPKPYSADELLRAVHVVLHP